MQTATVSEIEKAEKAVQDAKSRLNALKYPSVGEYQGNPVIHLSGIFTLGLVKAALAVKYHDEIEAFIKDNTGNSN